jgi:hypothetical protein
MNGDFIIVIVGVVDVRKRIDVAPTVVVGDVINDIRRCGRRWSSCIVVVDDDIDNGDEFGNNLVVVFDDDDTNDDDDDAKITPTPLNNNNNTTKEFLNINTDIEDDRIEVKSLFAFMDEE